MIFSNNIIQGEKINKEFSISNYPASLYNLKIAIRGLSSLDITATKNGDNFVIAVDTATLSGGTYAYQVKVYNESESHFIEDGQINIKADLLKATEGHEARSQAQIIIEAIDKMFAGTAGELEKRLKINNREVENYTIDELMKLRTYYAGILQMQRVKKKGSFSNIGVKF